MSCCDYQVAGGFKDLFIAPTFDELEQVARDAKGNPQKLSMKQLRSIRENGLVAVMSGVFRMNIIGHFCIVFAVNECVSQCFAYQLML